MPEYESAEDARRKFLHGLGEPANTAPPPAGLPAFTEAEFFEIGRGSTAGPPTGAIRRGLIFNSGPQYPKTAIAWETRDNTGTRTNRMVQCGELLGGNVYNPANVWGAFGGGATPGDLILQDLTGGPNAAKTLSITGLIAALDRKVDKVIPGPNVGLSVDNPVRRFGAATAITVTYSVGATAHAITSIQLNGAAQPLRQNGGTTVASSTTANTNKTFTLVVSTGTETTTAQASVVFSPERWAFLSSVDLFALADADITAAVLASGPGEFATGRAGGPRTFNCAQQFIYHYWPASFGAGSYVQNGLPSTAFITKNFNFTNAAGYTEAGLLTRSLSKQDGAQTVTAQ